MATIKSVYGVELQSVQAKIENILAQHGPFLTLASAARKAGLPLPTLSDAVRNGRVPSLHVFGKSLVRLRDVQSYADRNKTMPRTGSLAAKFEALAATVDSDTPIDLSINMKHYLYGHPKRKIK